MSATIAVLAKAPVPGRVKTRLCPPLDPRQAARLATAALADTLAAVASVPRVRRLLVLDGDPGEWVPQHFEIVRQRDGGLGDRLAGAFAASDGPTLVVGMDTPHLTSAALAHGLSELARPDVDAVLGLANDGGYWAIGLTVPDERAFDAVPMSTAVTGERQLQRLHELGLRVRPLLSMRDVDEYPDALAVAAVAPNTRFARELKRLTPSGAPSR